MTTTATASHTRAWILDDTGYGGIRIPKGACVLIHEDQQTWIPEAIRATYRGSAVLLWPEFLTLNPMEVQ